jgi:hypothetical protein
MRIRMRGLVLGLSALIGTVLLGSVGSSEARFVRPPKLVQVSYYEDREDGRRYNLQAHALRTDALKFSVRRGGKRIAADAKLNESISDTDLRGEARHPWVPVRNTAGKRLVRAVVDKLYGNGEVRLRIRLKGNGINDTEKVRIVLAECSTDPPLYPDPDCEVRP